MDKQERVRELGLIGLCLAIWMIFIGLAVSGCGGVDPADACAIDFSRCLAEGNGNDCHKVYEACMREVGR